MNAQTAQLEVSLDDRLRARLAELGLPVISVGPQGRAIALTDLGWFEWQLISSVVFAQAVSSRWRQLSGEVGELVEILPGVRMLGLVSQRRRRVTDATRTEPVGAVLFLDSVLAQGEALHRLCGLLSLDYELTRGRMSVDRLVSEAAAARLARTITWMYQDSGEVERRGGEIQSMGQELADSYEELSLLYKLSTNMTVNQPPANFLTDACEELQQVLGLRWMALQLTDGEPRLESLSGEVFVAGMESSALLSEMGRALLERVGSHEQATIVDDTRALSMPGLADLAQSLLVVPLHLQGKPLAILFGGDKLDGGQISSVDSKLCDSLGSSLTIFLDNLMLYKDMHAMFLGTLHALTSAIDAKDSYTHGHSERVAMMSRKLAEAAGLDGHTCERVYIAGLVHDVGKIGVPESVLCKPGKLTDDEFELIKRHPAIGARILQDIRQMDDLIPGVLYHHERWDGRGYPHGVSGEEIPLFGRLIGLADAFDAMSSNRTYRKALASQQVLDEIQRCGGSQFDPELTRIFVGLDFKPFYEMIAKHQDQQNKRSA